MKDILFSAIYKSYSENPREPTQYRRQETANRLLHENECCRQKVLWKTCRRFFDIKGAQLPMTDFFQNKKDEIFNLDEIDENKFVMNATLKICSSLDPDIALENLLLYIKDYIPVVGVHLGWIDTIANGFHFPGWATINNDKRPKPFIKIPRHLRERIYRFWRKNNRFEVINYDEIRSPQLKEITKLAWPMTSRTTMRLDMRGQRIGAICLWMKGTDRFTDHHLRLLLKLHDPIAIAMSNALKYQDIVKIKEDVTDDNRYLREQLFKISGDEIIGSDSGLKEVVRKIKQVAQLDTPVLLLGETGVGKEVIANTLHKTSTRKDGPFIKVNCGAIPDSLIDSELFGYEKGAFTGAVTQKRGRFEQAHNGTIFLDEIGELSMSAQVRLLRILETMEVVRVGGGVPIKVNIRVISATNKDLEEMVAIGNFREDLYFRLNVFPIIIPPLRQRKNDIPLLIHYFIKKKTMELNINKKIKIAPDTFEMLKDYSWPGNVRELENLVERSLIEANGNPHSVYLRMQPNMKRENKYEMQSFLPNKKILSLDQAIKTHIQNAMKISKGKVEGPDGAAELLRVHPSTLRAKMRKLNIPHGRLK